MRCRRIHDATTENCAVLSEQNYFDCCEFYVNTFIDECQEQHPVSDGRHMIGACILEPVIQAAGGMVMIEPWFQRIVHRVERILISARAITAACGAVDLSAERYPGRCGRSLHRFLAIGVHFGCQDARHQARHHLLRKTHYGRDADARRDVGIRRRVRCF